MEQSKRRQNRCVAVPYIEGGTEHAIHRIVGSRDYGQRWGWEDVFRHLFRGNGQTVDLAAIGQLRDVIEHYFHGLGRLDRLTNQIIAKARSHGEGSFSDTFRRSYDFSPVSRAHGNAVV